MTIAGQNRIISAIVNKEYYLYIGYKIRATKTKNRLHTYAAVLVERISHSGLTVKQTNAIYSAHDMELLEALPRKINEQLNSVSSDEAGCRMLANSQLSACGGLKDEFSYFDEISATHKLTSASEVFR
ncbi:hypothetical protein Trydic_g4189 [Trypoxylus dichotomus]